ncbi:MAG TPA: hypothetical protein VMB23_01620, partial [Spirochaetia bacterium]|nr:hypothetical protein [Spirochaetia bacterium]
MGKDPHLASLALQLSYKKRSSRGAEPILIHEGLSPPLGVCPQSALRLFEEEADLLRQKPSSILVFRLPKRNDMGWGIHRIDPDP